MFYCRIFKFQFTNKSPISYYRSWLQWFNIQSIIGYNHSLTLLMHCSSCLYCHAYNSTIHLDGIDDLFALNLHFHYLNVTVFFSDLTPRRFSEPITERKQLYNDVNCKFLCKNVKIKVITKLPNSDTKGVIAEFEG